MVFTVSGKVEKIQSQLLLRISSEISSQLPSRSMVMIEGEINGISFQGPLEPDGKGRHFLPMDGALPEELQLLEGDVLELQFDISRDWPEPDLPEDLSRRIEEEDLISAWQDLTVKARWEWIRWIRSTKNSSTRDKRIGVAISKLLKGDRRPCCFNTTQCTIPEIAKSGVLMDGANGV